MKDSRSVAGYDGMTNGILKGCNEDMKKLFLKVINHYWLDGSCPAEWKNLKIIPIAKPGKDIYGISSYRPTSLLPVLAKLAGSLVKDRLTRTIKRLKLKKGEAATTGVNYILNQTLQNTREGKTTVIGFLVLSAAFDNVNISKLL
jgi:hypothetical protein